VNILSLLGSYNVQVHLAFQDMKALKMADQLIGAGQAETLASGNTLRGTIPAYYLFRQNASSAHFAAEMLDLSKQEASLITSCAPGQCILAFSGEQVRIPLAVIAPQSFEDDFDTRTQAQKERLARRFQTRAALEPAGRPRA
jgi:hypothetical protein